MDASKVAAMLTATTTALQLRLGEKLCVIATVIVCVTERDHETRSREADGDRAHASGEAGAAASRVAA